MDLVALPVGLVVFPVDFKMDLRGVVTFPLPSVRDTLLDKDLLTEDTFSGLLPPSCKAPLDFCLMESVGKVCTIVDTGLGESLLDSSSEDSDSSSLSTEMMKLPLDFQLSFCPIVNFTEAVLSTGELQRLLFLESDRSGDLLKHTLSPTVSKPEGTIALRFDSFDKAVEICVEL
jgi:hypothetical protein